LTRRKTSQNNWIHVFQSTLATDMALSTLASDVAKHAGMPRGFIHDGK
jgi:hypothetical protein